MKVRIIVVLALLLSIAAGSVGAASLWDYQALNADGTGSHPLVGADPAPGNRVTVEGVALAGVNELWPNVMYTIFVQDEVNPRGGMQVWAGSWWYDTWRPAQYVNFSAGDRVRVTGFLGNHNGKVFINDRHSDDPDIIFMVEVIGHPGMPDPELIPSVANCNYFDHTRADGGERFQTRWSMLHGVQITAGMWANDGTLTITDPSGSVDLYLPPAANLAQYPQPQGKLNLVGIFDQEDTVAPFHQSYRLIVKSYDDIAEALGSCREVRQKSGGDRVALVNKIVSRIYDGCFYIQDADRSGGVKVMSSRVVRPGDLVNVQGVVSVSGSEKVITARYVAKGSSIAGPLYVNSQALHGESGLDVFGMLVRTVGTIGAPLGGGLYEFTDDAGRIIRLNAGDLAIPAGGTLVTLTAVVSGDPSMPVLLLSNLNDIKPVQ